MSRSPYFFVEKYDNYTERYELQHPFVWNDNHDTRIAADLFPYNGCHDMFSIIEGNSYGEFPDMKGIHAGLPIGVCDEIQQAYKDCIDSYFWNDKEHIYQPAVHWFTYADMYIYCLEHPTVIRYEENEDGDGFKTKTEPTPLITLKNRVDAFLEVMNDFGWEDDYSLIRIVCWII